MSTIYVCSHPEVRDPVDARALATELREFVPVGVQVKLSATIDQWQEGGRFTGDDSFEIDNHVAYPKGTLAAVKQFRELGKKDEPEA